MNTAPDLLVSRLDCERIEELLERPLAQASNASALREELARAHIVEPQAMPADVITMNSTARFRDESGEEREMTLVYPRDAHGETDRVSILAPVGTALLGLRVGQTIDWPMPGGRQARLQVLAVHYQPEAAGEYHR
ncbi:nucleoside diphosphate kinase regulator [Luteimonas gilva]|uniref:Nucleoside diphosphate kinase regulator n=1 Tax=Luteimonas gilva TaxID=2572684 RepID=A0A4U5JZ83_9GAMM|nr:nucleoside diphosphate kinase regulator [Luteimonas gilva]TKR34061.1 nucleoside diphosphate kinase regulator [Luteimonas gilva]